MQDEARGELAGSNCECRNRIKTYTFTNFLGEAAYDSTRFFVFDEVDEISEDLLANLKENIKYMLAL